MNRLVLSQDHTGWRAVAIFHLERKTYHLVVAGLDLAKVQALDDYRASPEKSHVSVRLGVELVYRQIIDANDLDAVVDKRVRRSGRDVNIVLYKIFLAPEI